MTTPSTRQIENELNEAKITELESKFPAMTYEQGVVAALEWVLGNTETPPMEDKKLKHRDRMNYKKEVNDFEKALSLEKSQVTRLKNAISNAYDQQWHPLGPNVDQINALVAPYIKTQEEAFYAATVIISDVIGAMNEKPIA